MRKFLVSILAVAGCAAAQENPISAAMKMEYGFAKTYVVRAAEKMPETNYGFKPTDDIRSFGQVVGHVADAQYMFCSAAAGEKSPATASIEQTKTTKADLVQALKDSVAYCDKVYDGMTDAAGAKLVNVLGRDVAKIGVEAFNNMHVYEHYGNMVTYMRLKNIVPPSSEPRPGAAPAKK